MNHGETLRVELTRTLRSQHPQCTSAAIVGSYACGRPFVDDIDIAAFDPSVPLGQEHRIRFEQGEWKIDMAVRNPGWMDPALAQQGDLLFRLRELRKLVAGLVLFDDTGALCEAMSWWREFQIPLHWVTPFYERVSRLDLEATIPAGRRPALYYGVENLVLGWTHADMRYQYSKPKWLMWDIALLGSEPCEELLRSLSAELCEAAEPGELCERVEAVLPARSADESPDLDFCRIMLRDTRFLAARGERLAAVCPLRVAGYQLAKWAAGLVRVDYRDIRSIGPLLPDLARSEPAISSALSAVLLLSKPVPDDFLSLFAAARRDFGRCLEERRARGG
jgi:hypothetical protein